jgi:hypothetical protein
MISTNTASTANGIQPEFVILAMKGWFFLLLAMDALLVAIALWGYRRYERLIRNLAKSHDT